MTAGRSRSAATPTPISRPSAGSASPAPILEVLRDFRHPVTIVTKSALIQRDLDILAEMATERLAIVTVSLTTLDRALARMMEPRAATPERRLETIAALAAAGVPTGVLTAPMIPALNDSEMEQHPRTRARRRRHRGRLYDAAPAARAEGLFREWLETHFPEQGRPRAVAGRAERMAAGSTIRPGRRG